MSELADMIFTYLRKGHPTDTRSLYTASLVYASHLKGTVRKVLGGICVFTHVCVGAENVAVNGRDRS